MIYFRCINQSSITLKKDFVYNFNVTTLQLLIVFSLNNQN